MIEHISAHVISVKVASDEAPYLGAHTISLLENVNALVDSDLHIRAVILEGGRKHFSAGANRTSLMTDDAQGHITSYVARVPCLLTRIKVPTVAAMAGHAIGGGFILGLLCDSAVLAEESLYGANFMALGFTPGMGATYIIEAALGPHLGREMLFSGRVVKGRELVASPLAHAIMPRAFVRNRAVAIAEEMASAPRRALELLKRRLTTPRQPMLEQALVAERAMHDELFANAATRELVEQRYAFSSEVTS